MSLLTPLISFSGGRRWTFPSTNAFTRSLLTLCTELCLRSSIENLRGNVFKTHYNWVCVPCYLPVPRVTKWGTIAVHFITLFNYFERLKVLYHTFFIFNSILASPPPRTRTRTLLLALIAPRSPLTRRFSV